jgi:UDP-N-acetylmuramyl pentapeptide synthase
MKRYAKLIHPNVVVVTSIGREHIRTFRSLDITVAEKARMVEALEPSGVAILNGDDLNVLRMKERIRGQIVTFGFGRENDLAADNVRLDFPTGTRFDVQWHGERCAVSTRLIGRTMVYSALAGIAVGVVEGLALRLAVSRLKELKPTPGRLEPLDLGNDIWALRDDHKGSLESYSEAIGVLGQIPRRRIAVVGDVTEEVGNMKPAYRDLGEQLGAVASRILIVGRRYRYISLGTRRAGLPDAEVLDLKDDFFRAVDLLRDCLRPGDVVLVKGRFEQKLVRLLLSFKGKLVGCRVRVCMFRGIDCGTCPRLAKGWGDRDRVP